jgi:hypothetical protein
MTEREKPSLLSGLSVSAVALILGILGVDLAAEYLITEPYQWHRRLMFFSEGQVFQNKDWGGFVYQANARIHSKTLYIIDEQPREPALEYEYDIVTNSLGLVQLNDVDSRPAIIFLGDSYTEGQGAPPWFYRLENRWRTNSPYQLINGGIIGTGFEAWERLYEDVSSTTKIAKAVVIFISADWWREVWQFSDSALQCLRNSSACKGSDSFLALPPDPGQAERQIERIASERIDYVTSQRAEENFLHRSALYHKVLAPAYRAWWPKPEDQAQFEKSKQAIRRLVGKLGAENILFIHLPQKNELGAEPSLIARQGTDFLRQNGLQFVDGFQRCGLTPSDFHVRDGHPNAVGYSKIENCIDHSIRETFRLITPASR